MFYHITELAVGTCVCSVPLLQNYYISWKFKNSLILWIPFKGTLLHSSFNKWSSYVIIALLIKLYFQIIYFCTPTYWIYFCVGCTCSIMAGNSSSYFTSVKFRCRVCQEESLCTKLYNYCNIIWKHIIKILMCSTERWSGALKVYRETDSRSLK